MPPTYLFRTLTSLTTLTLVSALAIRNRSTLTPLLRLFNPSANPTNFFILALAIILNAKSLPFAWHARFVRIVFYQLFVRPGRLPVDALFRPIITTDMYSPIPECDYNGHKSNSTYFSDLDMARTQFVSCVLREGIRAKNNHEAGTADGEAWWNAYHQLLAAEEAKATGKETALPIPPPPPQKGEFMIFLGAVSCHFKKEIKPYERYDIWTRILSWDRKWLYTLSTMVKAGTVMPEGWALQPWKDTSPSTARKRKSHDERQSHETNGHATSLPVDAEKEAEYKKAIFASSIAKYCVKKGRYTIPPEIVLRNSTLLPLRPDLDASIRETKIPSEAPEWWTWDNIEAERLRGLKIAGKFGALDGPGGLHDEFPVSKSLKGLSGKIDVLGEYKGLVI